MADVASTLRSWSSTASSNQPQGSTTIGSGLDDNLRQMQAVVRQFLADQSATVVPSAGVADLTTATGRWVPVSGSATITGFGTEAAGIPYLVTLTGSPTINNGNISTPGGSTIVGAVGDMFFAESQGSGVWRIHGYTRASGGPVRNRTRSVLTSSSTATYSVPAACVAINVRAIGGGGAGGGTTASSGADGGAGGDTVFGTITAGKGSGGTIGTQSAAGAGGSGGTATGGDVNASGGAGNGSGALKGSGGVGGSSFFGGHGGGGAPNAGGGNAAGYGGGGGGAGGNLASNTFGGGGGGAGAYAEKLIVNPSASYSYIVGAGGSAGGGTAGGTGQTGIIIVDEFYD